MATPDPEGFSLLGKVLTAGGVVATPIIWLWTKLDKKADKHTVNNQLQEVKNDIFSVKQTQAKIFDHLRDDRADAEKRHREVLMHLLERKQ
jgi:hypothetical protein